LRPLILEGRVRLLVAVDRIIANEKQEAQCRCVCPGASKAAFRAANIADNRGDETAKRVGRAEIDYSAYDSVSAGAEKPPERAAALQLAREPLGD
jgi:hypothetical protein